MIAFPSNEPASALGPPPFGANQRETLWRYRQAVWSPSLPAAAEADRRGEERAASHQVPGALPGASQRSASVR
jgi:hypothetical protein